MTEPGQVLQDRHAPVLRASRSGRRTWGKQGHPQGSKPWTRTAGVAHLLVGHTVALEDGVLVDGTVVLVILPAADLHPVHEQELPCLRVPAETEENERQGTWKAASRCGEAG